MDDETKKLFQTLVRSLESIEQRLTSLERKKESEERIIYDITLDDLDVSPNSFVDREIDEEEMEERRQLRWASPDVIEEYEKMKGTWAPGHPENKRK